jgi:hypothetical protein
MRALLLVLAVAGTALAQHRPIAPPPVAPGIVTPWVTSTCSIEPRWFQTLRDGPIDYCRKHLRFSPGTLDCVTFTDEVCWAVNQLTGEWTQLRNPGRETLFPCPDRPTPPVCPRLR